MMMSVFTYSPFDHIPAVDASVHVVYIQRQFVSWRNIEEDQMMHLPFCLPSIANPYIYKSHAGLLMCWGALLLKAGGLIVAVAAVVTVGRFPNAFVSLCYLCTPVLYRSGSSEDYFLVIVTSFVLDGLKRILLPSSSHVLEGCQTTTTSLQFNFLPASCRINCPVNIDLWMLLCCQSYEHCTT